MFDSAQPVQGLKSGNVSITSTGAEAKNVAVRGTGTILTTPSITVSPQFTTRFWKCTS